MRTCNYSTMIGMAMQLWEGVYALDRNARVGCVRTPADGEGGGAPARHEVFADGAASTNWNGSAPKWTKLAAPNENGCGEPRSKESRSAADGAWRRKSEFKSGPLYCENLWIS